MVCGRRSVAILGLIITVGFVYEMGGTWVSHHQPHTFTEMRRCGLDKDLIQTRQPDHGNDYFSINVEGQ